MTMDSVLSLTARRPRTADAALAAALTAVSLAVAGGQSGAFGWLCVAAVHVPLVWRRQAPLVVFWTVAALAGVSAYPLAVEGPYLLLAPLAALYTLARHRPRWQSLAVAGLAETALLWGWVAGELTWAKILGLAPLTAVTALAGTNLRSRRAYLDQREERERQRERDREQRALLAVATERERIAREMHDIVAHNLAVMVALADGAAFTATADPERAATVMHKVASTGRQALDEMQHLLDLLRNGTAGPSPGHTPQPGLADLDALVDQVRAAGPRVTVTREGVPGRWSPGAGLAVYRIVQEAFTNTLKHAGPAARIELRLRYLPHGVELEVVDDGALRRWTDADRAGTGGHGLVGMAERAGAYGGGVEAGPRPASGWRVAARMTFEHAAAAPAAEGSAGRMASR
ncbi:histidine kinase [Spirillospora sp. NPDC029432]|uniref:sensor histidine kinase n=1 Tax=Spirillospora sp. NPDC029432 TaxID=3154599 RepID=UPI00345339D4